MRIQLLSDLHLEFHRDQGESFVDSLDPVGVDVLVLAGDIAVGRGIAPTLARFAFRYTHVLYVPGNHEFYGCSPQVVAEEMRAAEAAHANVSCLDCGEAELEGVRFVGGTLWYREPEPDHPVRRLLADFQAIEGFEPWAWRQNARMLQALDSARPGDVVVTHHLPCEASVAPQWKDSELNAGFLCDVEATMRDRCPTLWLHGHTHASIDAVVGSTRVLCNPFGYPRELNPGFDPGFVVEV